jgi:penicillin-binding protein 2
MLIFDQLNKADRHLRLLSWCVAAGLAVLLGGLWWVQVVRSRHYAEDQRSQSSRTVRVPGPRGKILDRNGVALAENVPVYNISLYLHDRGWRALAWNEYVRMKAAAVAQTAAPARTPSWLARFLAWTGLRSIPNETRPLSVARRNELLRQSRYVATSNLVQQLGVALGQAVLTNEPRFYTEFTNHYDQRRALPLPILTGLNSSQIARFLEQGTRLPGLDMEIQPVRVYPQGTVGAHVLGYLRRSEESSEDELSFYNYRLPDYRGVSGIEYSQDESLHGKAGAKSMLVNNLGYLQGETVWSAVEAGRNVTLTLDADVQRIAEQALREAPVAKPVRGAAVVLDCRTGEIIALASAPGFDPSKFIPRISTSDFAEYMDKETKPLHHRGVFGGYPPGSTFKTVVALAALEAGTMDPASIVHVAVDPENAPKGCIFVGQRKIRDTANAGDYDFKRAFIKSSNSYFITNGLRVGPEAIIAMAEKLHFGERTGIPLGQDSRGILPTRDWIKKNRGPWQNGDTANLSIGQGDLLVTPLQMAVAMAAVANGGRVLTPRLVISTQGQDEIIDPATRGVVRPVVRDQLPVSPRTLRVIHEAMLADTEDAEGTGTAARVGGFRICAKTGTAQLIKLGHKKADDHIVWFASFGPYEQPRYAVVVMIESGSSGGGTCAPVAQKIYTRLRDREKQPATPRKNSLAGN